MWHDLFIYDESSPSKLIWNPSRSYTGKRASRDGKPAGTFAQGLRQSYYRVPVKFGEKVKRVMAHIVIWEMHNFKIPKGFEVDHVDGDTSNNCIENLRCVPMLVNKQNRKIINVHGVPGISITDNGSGREYATASWREGKKQMNKRFSIDDFGYDEAMRLAKEFRISQIERMNSEGANYTDRHYK